MPIQSNITESNVSVSMVVINEQSGKILLISNS